MAAIGALRLWLSGPRLFNGLVRPGISLGRVDLLAWRRPPSCKQRGRRLTIRRSRKIVAGAHPTAREARGSGEIRASRNVRWALVSD
ncbi:MAG: hypothetical protein CR217_19210 [Beijerinckiaceae bacterium]|nr:MAG: hypothetical protein CR217_19210 [Beijerinckiaceae bacterium]